MSTFKVCICIIIGFVITSKQVSGGQVRFRDGFSSTSGRVEVKPSSGGADWGNICSDDFDIIDADVICRQLDYAWALYVYNVSEYVGTKPAAISNLECDGNETNIFDCEREEHGTNMCEGVPGVGVMCIDLEYADLVPVKNLRIRTTGEDDTSGKLEIFDNDDWEPICSNEWDIDDTVTACRQLGFAFAVEFNTYIDPGYMGGIDLYKDFDCNGIEGYLLACRHIRDTCDKYVKVTCAVEFEDYNSGEEPYEQGTGVFSDYYQWINEYPCDDFECENGECFIDEYFDAVCDCHAEWKGDHCELPVDDGNSNNNNPPTDPPASSSDDVIIYVAIGVGVFVLLVATFVIIYVTYILRRRRLQRSTTKKPVEIGLKGKPVAENRRNNNTYQKTTGLPNPALNKPTSPPTEYYLEPSSDYVSPAEDYTALAPASEIYDEIPYDTIDNGGYMDLQPSENKAPPELPKPR